MRTQTKGLRTEIEQRWRFLRNYLQKPNVTGAVLPSSRSLAAAIAEPFRRSPRPVRVLEVGAGTGPITRYLGTILSVEDHLDICEIQPEFASILERDVLSKPVFRPHVDAGRVRLLCMPLQRIEGEGVYDFVISGLPMTAFELSDVEQVYATVRRLLKPDGVFSYFEYTWLRRTSAVLSVGRSRARLRAVSAFLSRNIREHEIERHSVFANVPPAHTRHLRFNRGTNGNGR